MLNYRIHNKYKTDDDDYFSIEDKRHDDWHWHKQLSYYRRFELYIIERYWLLLSSSSTFNSECIHRIFKIEKKIQLKSKWIFDRMENKMNLLLLLN